MDNHVLTLEILLLSGKLVLVGIGIFEKARKKDANKKRGEAGH